MTLVRVLDRMERDGWIERRPDPADRRAHRLHLKPASEPVLEEITRIGEKARNEALAGISADEREQMMTLLERVRSNLVALLPAREPSPPPESRATRQKARQAAACATRRARRHPHQSNPPQEGVFMNDSTNTSTSTPAAETNGSRAKRLRKPIMIGGVAIILGIRRPTSTSPAAATNPPTMRM